MHGIGGSTVAEAKNRLSYAEAQNWFLFARQRGGISHTDRLLATIATQISRLSGGKAEIGDFLPALRTRALGDEKVADIGEVQNILAMVAT